MPGTQEKAPPERGCSEAPSGGYGAFGSTLKFWSPRSVTQADSVVSPQPSRGIDVCPSTPGSVAVAAFHPGPSLVARGAVGFDAVGDVGHLVLDRVAQQLRGGDVPAATKASSSAYSTEEIPLWSFQSLAKICFSPYMDVSLYPSWRCPHGLLPGIILKWSRPQYKPGDLAPSPTPTSEALKKS